jgi:uncharacterized alkaline shock family protein YloU
MKAGQRIILVAYSLLVIAIVVLFALLVCGSFGVDNTIKFIKEVSDNVLYLAAIITIAVSLVVISFCMMFLCVRGQESSTLIKATENGSIRISLDTVNAIAAKAVKSVPLVRDVRVKAVNTEKGMVVNVKIALMNDSVIPEVTMQVQNVIKSQAENIFGLAIAEVPILVDNSIVSNN